MVSAEACIAFIKSTTAYFVKYQSLLSCSCKNNKAEGGYRFIFGVFVYGQLPAQPQVSNPRGGLRQIWESACKPHGF